MSGVRALGDFGDGSNHVVAGRDAQRLSKRE